ncbi:MAG TPA: EpsI family protein [Gemmatimonadaceae bacterium]|nr:EpsI family protein [Gemmatimonadaceae bacterium]
MRDLRRFLPALLLAAGCVFVWNARSQAAVPLAAPLTSVMPEVPGYRVQEQRISTDERRVAGMSDYVARIYWRDSVPAFTTFVSYYERQTQGKTIHSPRNCMPGAGWAVMSTDTKDVMLDGQPVTLNRSLLRNGAATALVFYWYQGRGRLVANEYAVKWNLLRDAALEGHTEEALVRVVVPLPRTNEPRHADKALADAEALGTDMATRLAREVRRVLPGA